MTNFLVKEENKKQNEINNKKDINSFNEKNKIKKEKKKKIILNLLIK